jgi:hypothetical protein
MAMRRRKCGRGAAWWSLRIAALLVGLSAPVSATLCDCGAFCVETKGACGVCKPVTDAVACKAKPKPVVKPGRPRGAK